MLAVLTCLEARIEQLKKLQKDTYALGDETQIMFISEQILEFEKAVKLLQGLAFAQKIKRSSKNEILE